MTDLERVRECLYQYCNDCYFDEDSGEWGDCVCGGEVAQAGQELTAHLKEDAERDERFGKQYSDAVDEINQLREQNADLLAALKAFVDTVSGGDGWEHYPPQALILAEARAAIAEVVEGEKP